MSGYLLEWAGMLVRWLHVITGIAWIGSSFYFVWLDNSLKPPVDPALREKGVGGELWAVHGGGFYNPQKYLVAPAKLPEELHWFKWESYWTFLSGFLLITLVYYARAASQMVDASVADLSPAAAVGVGVGALALGWVVYDGLCRLLIDRSQLLFGAVYYLFVVASAWGLTHLISGRAAFVHVGAMMATTMTANVFFWIIPGQKAMVDAMRRGEAPDPIHGKRGKQRSVHNNYLTLPVLFCMISNHYAFTYGHPQAWAVLALIGLAAVLIRHFFNLRHKGELAWRYPAAGVAILAAVAAWIAPRPVEAAAGPAVSDADAAAILQARCVSCHATHPTQAGFASPPLGLVLEDVAVARAAAEKIHRQVVETRVMPLGNLTQMTEDERARLGRWAADAMAGP
jgi:uncharacterized membrane protein